MIGVHSKDLESDFDVEINALTADFDNSHFIKMGYPQRDTVEAGSSAVYKFIIDTKSSVKVDLQVSDGSAELYLGSGTLPTQHANMLSISGSGSATIDESDQKFKTAVMYTIVVENKGTTLTAFTLTLSQDQSVINLQDGVPLKVTF